VALADNLRDRLLLGPLDEADPRWRMLLREAERIKIALSGCWSFHWTPPPLGGRAQADMTLYREDLERLMRFSIRQLIHTLRRLWDRHSPELLLLVGGSSRIPLLQEIIEREVARPERLSLGAEDAVVRGAALYTAAGRERLLLDALSGDLVAVWEGRARRLIPSEAALPARADVELEAGRSGREKLELLQSRNELRRESVSLASLELDVEAGERLSLACELSAAGRLAAAVRRESGERLSVPLALEGGPRERDLAAENGRRIRELKLSLVALETLLTRHQQDQLHLLFRRAEGASSDPETLSLLEGLVRDLERAVS
ncbi:MAG: Hsp70 family protein, partial [Synergistaceae bacterium]|nr:Hsp70 family protein [Synergistaceae bacterium]